MSAPALVPAPRLLETADGPAFVLTPATALRAEPGTEDTARWLRGVLGAAAGLDLPPAGGAPGADGADGADGAAAEGVLHLRTDSAVSRRLGPEGYVLESAAGRLTVTGGSAAGVFWGAQTLRQLLGPAAHRRAAARPAGTAGEDPWQVPALYAEDAPRFSWRGYMLDVARHFMPKDGVLRVVDLLAAHKLNVLHLHLTDDQGWRVQIRSRPRLTEVGATRARTRVGHRGRGDEEPVWDERAHGGCYSQDDLREIVAYAAARHVTVVPEIDIPGHSQAAVAAYPELGNTDAVDTAALEVWPDWGVSPNVLAPTDTVLRFYEGVLEEVLEIFPAPFVHLGGDECPTDQWRASATAQARIRQEGLADEGELQAWFTRHFARWLAERGRRLVGWDEILEGGSLPDGAAVSSWRGHAGGVAAARAGHDVVMCPEQHVYLDHRQDAGPDEPVPIGHVRTLRDVYHFEPVPPQLAGTPAERHVLGAQANMWTECAEIPQRVDYQTFPRLAAFAEVAWSPLPPPRQRDFAGFERRMAQDHYARLDALGVDYRPPSGPHPWQRRPGVPGRPLDGPPPGL